MIKRMRKALKRVRPIEATLAVCSFARSYRVAHGRYPRILKPRTFSEKVCRRVMFDRRPILTRLADKYESRVYTEERLGSAVLPRLYHLTADPATIPWDALPSRYVIKATHGSGWIRIVTGAVDREAIVRLCTDWLRQNYYWHAWEWPYRNARPRILIEEFLDGGDGSVPLDFKFFVFDGRPAIIQVDASRFSGHTRSFYDLGWKRQPVRLLYPPVPIEVPRPAHLEEMTEAAARLGRGMDFVRVDLYDTPRQYYVGEITTTPEAGLAPFDPVDFDEALGKHWIT